MESSKIQITLPRYDVMSLVDKCIVTGFFGRDFNRILSETEKNSANIMATESRLVSCVDKALKSWNTTFYTQFDMNKKSKCFIWCLLFNTYCKH